MSNILSVGASSPFSAQPVDAAGSAQEELDPRFVEELQGALGQQEAELSTQPVALDETSQEQDIADNQAAPNLQNLPLMPWMSVAMPANFASPSAVVNGPAAETGAVEGVASIQGARLPLPLAGSDVTVLAQVAASAAAAMPAEHSVASQGDASPMALRHETPAALMQPLDEASVPQPVADVSPQVSGPLTSVDASSAASVGADSTLSGSSQSAPVTALALDAVAAKPLNAVSTHHALPSAGTPSQGVTAPPSGAVSQSGAQVATAPASMSQESAAHTRPIEERGGASNEVTSAETQRASAMTQENGGAQTSVAATLAQASVSVAPAVPTDRAVLAQSAGITAADSPVSVSANQGDGAAPVVVAASQGFSVDAAASGAMTVAAQEARANEVSLSATSTLERQAPVVAAAAQDMTASPTTSTLEAAVATLGGQVGNAVRGASRQNEMASADDRSTPINADATSQVGSPSSPDTLVLTRTAVSSDASHVAGTDAQAAAAPSPETAGAAGQLVRHDAVMAVNRHDVDATDPASSADLSVARVAPDLKSASLNAGGSATATQDTSAAESTFASSFVQALMGQVHHSAVPHSQRLEVVPAPAPMAPHQVRFDDGQVQVEVVRLVKQGGGQVVMELTPPDESKFKIDLSINQQGVARLVVDGASESTRWRLEQTVSGLQDQFQQMGLQLQLDMRQPHQQESRAQSDAAPLDMAGSPGGVPRSTVADPQPMTGRPTWEQGQVYLVA